MKIFNLLIFQYLNEIYGLNPQIENIDYSFALTKTLPTENMFNNKPQIILCFFHFIQSCKKNEKT